MAKIIIRSPGVTAALAGLAYGLCLIVVAAAKDSPAPNPSPTMHASLIAYPDAVISLIDPTTGFVYSVESNGRSLVAQDKDGTLRWRVNVADAAGITADAGRSVIRHLTLEGDHLLVTCGKSHVVKVQLGTGATTYIGAD